MDDERFKKELEEANSILQRNRHRSCAPYEWFGPDPEPCEAGKNCSCAGCKARFEFEN